MEFIVFDLEWNQPEGADEEIRHTIPFEIIEIGAVKLDKDLNLIGKFNQMIRPQVYKEINWRIRKMLNLQPGELEKGRLFPDAAKEFMEWCGSDPVFCTWGGQDLTELQRNLTYYDMPPLSEKPFEYVDVQKLYARKVGEKRQFSLESAVDEMGIEKDVAFHRAFSDAYYTGMILKALPESVRRTSAAYDLYRLPRSREEEIYLRSEDSYTFYSQGYDERNDIISDARINTIWCPKCGGPSTKGRFRDNSSFVTGGRSLKRRIKWFGHMGRTMHAAGICPEHGPVIASLKIRTAGNGKYFAEKTTNCVSREEYDKLAEQKQKSDAK
ncbi:MAG: exonuclease domain-containing protein [Lachnospiraceae bacterium]|nr:exonuclease domain-containing protein [Lachnospiraceae bacterium]